MQAMLLLILIVAPPTLPAIPVALPATEAEASDPLVSLWRLREQLMPLCTGTDEQVDLIGARITEIDEEIIATPAATVAGLLVKFLVMDDYGMFDEFLTGRMLK